MNEPVAKPKRIQRKRTKGWKMPPNTVSVTRPGKYGNPFKHGGTDLMMRMFRSQRQNYGYPSDEEIRRELRGKNLACFCDDDATWCHANDLIEIANGGPSD